MYTVKNVGSIFAFIQVNVKYSIIFFLPLNY